MEQEWFTSIEDGFLNNWKAKTHVIETETIAEDKIHANDGDNIETFNEYKKERNKITVFM